MWMRLSKCVKDDRSESDHRLACDSNRVQMTDAREGKRDIEVKFGSANSDSDQVRAPPTVDMGVTRP